MLLARLISFTKRLEDPECPLLGPNLKALYVFGLWQTGGRAKKIFFKIFYVSGMLFVATQIVDLYISRQDLNNALSNFSLTTLSLISYAKWSSFVFCQRKWVELIKNICQEEKREIKKGDRKILIAMSEYTKYSRTVTFSYWIMVALTTVGLILTPLIRYLSAVSYRDNISNGIEPLPQIIHSWFPFDGLKMPGYVYASIVHMVMSIQGSGALAVYDTTAVAIMTFLKGQLRILREKCADIFKGDEYEDTSKFFDRIKECHRHHNFLEQQYQLFDNLLSPVMFLYVTLCSITICCSVVQFISKEATASQRLWVIQYTSGQIFQLFLYCWHANEVFIESQDVDKGVFASDWWKSDRRLRKQILLLASKLNHTFRLRAGPFTDLSIPTFISILKGSYSFFTLFSRIAE